MKVVLLENLDKKGNKGDIIEVSDGFAMNNLIPKKLAKIVTPNVLKEIEAIKAKEEKLNLEKITEATKIKDKLNGYKLIIKSKANEEGHLFGAVDEKAIANNLKEKGFEITPEMIKLEKHFKEVGEYEVDIELVNGLNSKIKLDVQAGE
ncbi:MAG: 50S ribosomal protein L9 [Patescibacteria group bacterium]